MVSLLHLGRSKQSSAEMTGVSAKIALSTCIGFYKLLWYLVIYQWNLSFPGRSLQSLSHCLNPLICGPFQDSKRSLSGTQKCRFQLRQVRVLRQVIASNVYTSAYLSHVCTCWKKSKYMLCATTIIFLTGHSKINIYYCLCPYL